MTRTRDKGGSTHGGDFDVAIVGASLAGCATAMLLGRTGLRVALVDKHSGPDAYKRLCGHYIQASATPVIERLGLADPIEADGGVRNGLDIWTRWGAIASPEPGGRRPHGYSIRRSKLDPLIRRLALETPGVEYRPDLEATGLLGSEHEVLGVEVRDRAGRRTRIAAQLVVGADGRNSKVAKLAGARERHARNERFCYMAYFTGVGLAPGSNGRLWALDPDVAIASPNDDGLTILAAFLHKRRLAEFRTDRVGALRNLFATLPEGPEMTHAELAGKVIGYTDYGIVDRDPAPRRGVALVGDAALTCDPVMAIGCGWALQSAEWLADSVAPALGGAESLGTGLRRYRRIRRRRLLPHHRMLTVEARGRDMNPLQRLLFSAGARDPRTAALLHRYAERAIPPRRLVSPRALGRAARINGAARVRGRESRPASRPTSRPTARGVR